MRLSGGARKWTTGASPYGSLYVGRKSETDLLRERWEMTKEGQGQVVMLTGEPGIGKTRLKDYFKETISGNDFIKTESYCSPYHTNSALYPEIETLKKTFGLSEEDTPSDKLEKVTVCLDGYGLTDTIPLFASALSLDPGDPGSLDMPPQMLKRKTLESMVRLLHSQAESKPVLKVLEDIQWADPSTIEYLTLLIEQIAPARIMLFLISRPTFKAPWEQRSYFTHITLNRLTRKQAQEMVSGISGTHTVSDEIMEEITDKADGVPLFLEEITKMVIDASHSGQDGKPEGGEEKASRIEIPSTLQNLLMARIDRYQEHKSIVRMGAAIGRGFSYELLRAVTKAGDEELSNGLSRFVGAEILYEKGVPPHSTYYFKHALIQKAAYESVLKKKRKEYHKLIGETLERDFPERSGTEPEILATPLHRGRRDYQSNFVSS